MRPTRSPSLLLTASFLVVIHTSLAQPATPSRGALREALTFHASFDRGIDADFASGDGRLHTAASFSKRSEATPGLHASNITVIARGAGRFGDALRFTKKKAPLVFFNAAGNIAWRATNWSGTVSLWLNTDPAGELEPGFCDPLQIGLFDELSFFNRALTDAELKALHALPEGVAGLLAR